MTRFSLVFSRTSRHRQANARPAHHAQTNFACFALFAVLLPITSIDWFHSVSSLPSAPLKGEGLGFNRFHLNELDLNIVGVCRITSGSFKRLRNGSRAYSSRCYWWWCRWNFRSCLQTEEVSGNYNRRSQSIFTWVISIHSRCKTKSTL